MNLTLYGSRRPVTLPALWSPALLAGIGYALVCMFVPAEYNTTREELAAKIHKLPPIVSQIKDQDQLLRVAKGESRSLFCAFPATTCEVGDDAVSKLLGKPTRYFYSGTTSFSHSCANTIP